MAGRVGNRVAKSTRMREDSYSDLFGRGPAAARARERREQQSSGFFDLQSLYTTELERMQALQGPAVISVPEPELLPQLPFEVRARQATAMDAYEVALTRGIPRPIGWYAVFVTWLVTVTLAVGATTQVPAHVRTRVHPVVATAAAPAAAAARATAAAPATATPTAPARATATAAATATAVPKPSPTPTATASSAVPIFLVSDLPRAQTKTEPPAHAKWVARSKRRAAPAHVAAPTPAPTPTPTPAAAPAPAPVAVAPPPAPAATTATPVAATPLATGGTLEDLIRREVAAEQKKVRAAKAQ